MKIERAQFEQLALEQMDMLFRVARRLSRDAVRAEDLVQETFVRALRARDTFDLQEYGIRPWLLRILHNLHLNSAQRENRQPVGLEDDHLEGLASASQGDTGLPLDPRSLEGMDEQLVRAIEQIPEEYASVLMLWAVEDFSYKEISESLEIPIGTVMSRLHRARQRLSEQLRDYALQERIIRE
jgi:RNA polymerase sigma-70 factor, ECF subfamily